MELTVANDFQSNLDQITPGGGGGGILQLKIKGGGAGSIVWGLRFWLEKIFWGS